MKLNIGCGSKILKDWINIDKFPIDDRVVYGDLNEKIGLPDACADEILLDNVIEHVDAVETVMEEMFRLLKVGGVLRIYTPHYSSQSSWRDPTHRHHLSYFSFDYFCGAKRGYIGGSTFYTLEKKLSFGGGLSILGRLIHRYSPAAYEKNFCFIFPASTIRVTLRKIDLAVPAYGV